MSWVWEKIVKLMYSMYNSACLARRLWTHWQRPSPSAFRHSLANNDCVIFSNRSNGVEAGNAMGDDWIDGGRIVESIKFLIVYFKDSSPPCCPILWHIQLCQRHWQTGWIYENLNWSWRTGNISPCIFINRTVASWTYRGSGRKQVCTRDRKQHCDGCRGPEVDG